MTFRNLQGKVQIDSGCASYIWQNWTQKQTHSVFTADSAFTQVVGSKSKSDFRCGVQELVSVSWASRASRLAAEYQAGNGQRHGCESKSKHGVQSMWTETAETKPVLIQTQEQKQAGKVGKCDHCRVQTGVGRAELVLTNSAD